MDPNRPCVTLTGASGFVGTHVLAQLVQHGCAVTAPVRTPQRNVSRSDLITTVETDFYDVNALRQTLQYSNTIIHLIGIITENHRLGQTFERVHQEITANLVNAAVQTGHIQRFILLSALGSRPDTQCRYHRTKWLAEQTVRHSGLNWTIFQPSIIHGPDGRFMHMIRDFWINPLPPFVPYFARGLFGKQGGGRVQPVWVNDVAKCLVLACHIQKTAAKTYTLGGPDMMTWPEMYRLIRQYLPQARRKPVLPFPVWLARIMAKLPNMPFNNDQIIMSQEDSICNTADVQRDFSISLKSFENALMEYAAELTRETPHGN